MKADYFSKDILEFIRLLYKYRVQYVIVGGEAVIYYGYPRLTGDVDFFYDASRDNVKKLYEALDAFWQGDIPGIEKQDELLEIGAIFQFGVPPNRIDLVNTIDGVTFGEAWENRKTETIKMEKEFIQLTIIGHEQLIKNKEALRRDKDLDDLRYLKEAFQKKKS